MHRWTKIDTNVQRGIMGGWLCCSWA